MWGIAGSVRWRQAGAAIWCSMTISPAAGLCSKGPTEFLAATPEIANQCTLAAQMHRLLSLTQIMDVCKCGPGFRQLCELG